MLKKYLSLQAWLDTLFDDNWCTLGLPEGLAAAEWPSERRLQAR